MKRFRACGGLGLHNDLSNDLLLPGLLYFYKYPQYPASQTSCNFKNDQLVPVCISQNNGGPAYNPLPPPTIEVVVIGVPVNPQLSAAPLTQCFVAVIRLEVTRRQQQRCLQ